MWLWKLSTLLHQKSNRKRVNEGISEEVIFASYTYKNLKRNTMIPFASRAFRIFFKYYMLPVLKIGERFIEYRRKSASIIVLSFVIKTIYIYPFLARGQIWNAIERTQRVSLKWSNRRRDVFEMVWYLWIQRGQRFSRGIPQKFKTGKDNLFCHKGK